DVVANARPRMREGRDVVGDPHGARYANSTKRAPSLRPSDVPRTIAGTAVGETVKRTRQTPFRGRSGTVRCATSVGSKVTFRPSAVTVCGLVKRLSSLATTAVMLPPRQRNLVYVTPGPDQPSG